MSDSTDTCAEHVDAEADRDRDDDGPAFREPRHHNGGTIIDSAVRAGLSEIALLPGDQDDMPDSAGHRETSG
jgi:hypothetical protein